MYEYYFSLCGIPIWLSSVLPLTFWEPVEEFAIADESAFREYVNSRKEVVEHYRLGIYSGILPEPKQKLFDCFKFMIYREGEQLIYRYRVGCDINPYFAVLTLNPQASTGVREHELLLPESYGEEIASQILFSSLLGFESMAKWHGRIPMHAASVMMNDRVVLFTGPSGMGKSTQSNLWISHLHAMPVNGDKTILCPGEQGITAYGSFYAGSSEIIHNRSGEIGAILTLQQGPENIIRRLGKAEAYRKLYPRFLVGQWDREVTSWAMEMIQKVILSVPVYELSCRPDAEAAELAYKTIFHQ